ncbi:MAG: hypothetical protein ABL952_15545, partial [Pyrinomonadaceae bacterium]
DFSTVYLNTNYFGGHGLWLTNLTPFTLYTYRVKGLDAYRDKISKSKATGVTAVVKNELGERSFSFVAPDGYFWTLVE